MSLLQLVAILVTLAAVFSYVNYKFIKLPTTIGVMFLALVTSLLMVLLGEFTKSARDLAKQVLDQINFQDLVLHGMLSVLLFAGALHIRLEDLRKQWLAVSLLATVGTAVSFLLVGVA